MEEFVVIHYIRWTKNIGINFSLKRLLYWDGRVRVVIHYIRDLLYKMNLGNSKLFPVLSVK